MTLGFDFLLYYGTYVIRSRYINESDVIALTLHTSTVTYGCKVFISLKKGGTRYAQQQQRQQEAGGHDFIASYPPLLLLYYHYRNILLVVPK